MNLRRGDLKHRLLLYRRAQVMLSVALLVFAIGVYAFWIRPANRTLDSAYSRCTAARRELMDDQSRPGNLPRIGAKIDTSRKRVQRLEKTPPKERQLTQFMDAAD